MIVRSLFVSLGVAISGATGLKSFDDAINKTKTDAEKADEAIRRLSSSGTALSKGFASVLNTIGGKDVLQRFAVNLADADKGFAHAADHAGRLGASVRTLGRDMAYVAAGVTAAALGIGALTASAAEDARFVENQAKTFGLTTDAYQEYRAVFADFKVDQRDVADLFSQITQMAQMAGNGAGNIVQAFENIDVKVADVKGKKPEAVLLAIADGMARTTDDAKRLSSAGVLLGEDLTKKMTPLLMKGTAGIDALRESVRKSGMIRSPAALVAAGTFAKNLGQIQKQAKGVAYEFADGVIPALNQGAEAFRDWVDVNREWISQRLGDVIDYVGRGVRFAEQGVVRFNRALEALPGGKDTALRALAAGVVGLAGGLVLFRVGGPAYEGLQVLYGLAAGLGALAGIATGPAFAILLAFLGAFAIEAAIVGTELAGAYLVIEDFVYFLQGKGSIFGRLQEWLRGSGETGKALAEQMDDMKRIFDDLVIILPIVGDKLADLASRGFDAVTKSAKEAYSYVKPFVDAAAGLVDRSVAGYVGANGLRNAGLADMLDSTARGMQQRAYVPQGAPLPPDVIGQIRQRPAGGGESVSIGGDTITIPITGVSDAEGIRAAIRNMLEERERTKLAKARGGAR